MKRLTGTVFRSPSGYTHSRGATIQDVLNFERYELGNDDQTLDVPEHILTAPAAHCTWVALDAETAGEYNLPNEIVEIEVRRAVIIASDECGGLLIHQPNVHI
ncbi:MAG: hypothetical protein AAFN11_00025 [Chloroflexota bacterium]